MRVPCLVALVSALTATVVVPSASGQQANVMIFNEMVHNARIIPTDGRPHGTLPRWTGDSRGRWEGDTLVVETLNFRRETSLQGSTARTTVVERLTRLDAKTIDYRFTISDPDAYTKPWTAVMPLRAIDGSLVRVRLPRGPTTAWRASSAVLASGRGKPRRNEVGASISAGRETYAATM